MVKINHIAFSTTKFDDFRLLLLNIGFTIKKESGYAPLRQMWFNEGIQLIESSVSDNDLILDHIAFENNCINTMIDKATSLGCSINSRGSNWLNLTNKVLIEFVDSK